METLCVPVKKEKQVNSEQYHPAIAMVFSKLRSISIMLFIFICLVGAAFVANVCQGLSYIFVRPLSLGRHRKICLLFAQAFFLCSTFLLERWSSITFKLYGDRILPHPSQLTVINHLSNVDWLLGLAFIAKLGYPYPGNAKSVVKASLGQVPLFGSLLRFSEFLFLTRSWETDRENFLRALVSLRGFSDSCAPLWFTLYPEGTRLTPDKLERSQAYAVSKKLQPLNHVLFPRFKAFTAIVTMLRDDFDGIVDATFMFEGDVPTVKSVLAGTSNTVVHVYAKYYRLEDIPQGEEQLEKWLLDRWYEKDTRIANFKADPSVFGPPEENYFSDSSLPSLAPLYMLVSVYFIGAAATMYGFSRIPNGLYILTSLSSAAVVLIGIVTALNIRPSRKGSSSAPGNKRRTVAGKSSVSS